MVARTVSEAVSPRSGRERFGRGADSAEGSCDEVVDGVAVVLVEHVVQVTREDPQCRERQRLRDGPGVVDRDDPVGFTVDEQGRYCGVPGGEAGGDVRPGVWVPGTVSRPLIRAFAAGRPSSLSPSIARAS